MRARQPFNDAPDWTMGRSSWGGPFGFGWRAAYPRDPRGAGAAGVPDAVRILAEEALVASVSLKGA